VRGRLAHCEAGLANFLQSPIGVGSTAFRPFLCGHSLLCWELCWFSFSDSVGHISAPFVSRVLFGNRAQSPAIHLGQIIEHRASLGKVWLPIVPAIGATHLWGGLIFLPLHRWDLVVVLFRLGRGSCCGLLLCRVTRRPRSGPPVYLHCLRRVKDQKRVNPLCHCFPLPQTSSLNPNPMPFQTDPIPGWSGLLDGPLLGPAPTECVSGCQLLVRAVGLDLLKAQSKGDIHGRSLGG